VRLAIMQPYFFPYLGYFQLIAAADKFILYDNLHYIRKGWMHRNRIRIKGRDPLYCSVPVRGASSQAYCRQVCVDHTQRWPGKFLEMLTCNYQRAPFFAEVYPVIEHAVTREATYLMEVNYRTLTAITALLEIPTVITQDITAYEPFEAAVGDPSHPLMTTLRDTISAPDLKTLRVLYICRSEHADVYLNPMGGQAIYAKEVFARNQVTLQFVEPHFRPYPQFDAAFIPGLSIIDVLMHCGREGTQQLLHDYTLR